MQVEPSIARLDLPFLDRLHSEMCILFQLSRNALPRIWASCQTTNVMPRYEMKKGHVRVSLLCTCLSCNEFYFCANCNLHSRRYTAYMLECGTWYSVAHERCTVKTIQVLLLLALKQKIFIIIRQNHTDVFILITGNEYRPFLPLKQSIVTGTSDFTSTVFE